MLILNLSNSPRWATQRCSNPQYSCTIVFRACDGLNRNSVIRFTVYDVREKVSQTAVPLGSAEVVLGTIQEIPRLRIPIQFDSGNAGFITMTTYLPEQDHKHTRSPAKQVEKPSRHGHRRSQSLPPRLGVKLIVPPQQKLAMIFVNPTVSANFYFLCFGRFSLEKVTFHEEK